MPSAMFVVPLGAGGPEITMEQLGQVAGATMPDGTGWSVCGHIPNAPTCLVRITATEDVLDDLASQDGYLFVEDVAEEVV
jgi:hypothetical protein